MTEQEARKLKVGDVVMWNDNPQDLGMVMTIGLNGVYVHWELAQAGWIAFTDLASVSIYESR